MEYTHKIRKRYQKDWTIIIIIEFSDIVSLCKVLIHSVI